MIGFLAPVNEGTVGKVKGDLEALGAKLYGAGKFGITPKIGADAPVEFNVKASQATAVRQRSKSCMNERCRASTPA